MRSFIAPLLISCISDFRQFYIFLNISLFSKWKWFGWNNLNSLYLEIYEMLLTILKHYYTTIDHYLPKWPTTRCEQYLLVPIWNMIYLIYVYTSMYVEFTCFHPFFYILCWRGRYVEANSAEFDFILPLSLSWCNLCGRNRATGTHISTFVLINLNFVNEFTLFYFKTNLLFIFFKMNFVFF